MKKRGFTLIELLVVIAIIAMLLAILIPVLGKTKAMARKVVCKSNLKQWGLVFGMYTQDNGGRFVPGASWGGLPPENLQKSWLGSIGE
jgi:prepilin-type N-terminal cleavage/methylation domain-containing protein